jgi:mono/diheme cytochrome c family protein
MREIMLTVAVGLLSLPVSAVAADKAKIDQGKALFTTQKCTLCHSIGTVGNKKGPLDDVGAKLKNDEIREWLKDPVAMQTKTKATRTPAMKPPKLSQEQVEAIAAYLETLKTSAAAPR